MLDSVLGSVNEFIISESGALWVYPLLFAVCIIDAFFPPVPSESVLVTLGSLSGSTGKPFLWAIISVAAVGAVIGDNIAYSIGNAVGTDRWKWMRKPKVAAGFDWARRALDGNGPMIILTARFIPIGRIAVNMTAGATRYPRRTFFPLTIVAGAIWATYSALMGNVVGEWFEHQPLLGTGVAIVVAVVMGFVIDRGVQLARRRRNAPDQRGDAEEPVGKADQ